MRFKAMSNRLERSDILFEFLAIMCLGAYSTVTAEAAAAIAGAGRGCGDTSLACRRLWASATTAYIPLGSRSGAANWSRSQIALFLKPIQPSRPVGACGFRPTIYMSTAMYAAGVAAGKSVRRTVAGCNPDTNLRRSRNAASTMANRTCGCRTAGSRRKEGGAHSIWIGTIRSDRVLFGVALQATTAVLLPPFQALVK